MYWKMTNLCHLWTYHDSLERKNHVKRSGSIVWSFLPSGRSISAYNSGEKKDQRDSSILLGGMRNTRPLTYVLCLFFS